MDVPDWNDLKLAAELVVVTLQEKKGFIMKNLQITAYTQHFIRQQVMPGDICIDATMGNGNDTALSEQACRREGSCDCF